MNLEKEQSIIEAILFLESEPISLSNLSKISNLPKNVVEEALLGLKEHYKDNIHSLSLLEIQNGYLLSVKEELYDNLKEYYGKKNEEKLSKAAMETLSIIAYSQPLTKSEIENIRGVSSDGMIRLLFKKGLIRELGKKDVPGKPMQFGTSKEFLRLFKLKSIADLPRLDEVEERRFELNG